MRVETIGHPNGEPPIHPTGSGASRPGKRIVLTTLGSLGDIHPFIAIALGLKARGHSPVLVSGEFYRGKIQSLGLEFRPLLPDSHVVTDPVIMRRFMDYRWGTIRILREFIVPAIRDSYECTLRAVEGGADLLVSHPLTFATRLVAEKTGIPWVSAQISPISFGSAHDPSALPIVPDLSERLRFLGPRFWNSMRWALARATRSWAGPIDRLRSEIGLPPTKENPLVDTHSPSLVLALFSKLLADKQPDWPPRTIQCGFPIYDRRGGAGLPAPLARFLDEGPPPVVFTLGDTSAMVAGQFFERSTLAAQRLGLRAILIVGRHPQAGLAPLPDGVVAFDYAPYSELFPRAAAVVHAGGIGSTGLAMRSGRPMLVVPFAHDQPDNASRLARLGIARTIPGHRYTSARAEAELRRLLNDEAYERKAAEIGNLVRGEDGVRLACDALEEMMAGETRPSVAG